MDLTNEDVSDILALLDSLPYDELDLQTPRFRLTLRRTTSGWTRSEQVLSAPHPLAATGPGPDEADGASGAWPAGESAPPAAQATATMSHRGGQDRVNVTSLRPEGGTDGAGAVAEGAEGTGTGRAEAEGTGTGRVEAEGSGAGEGDGAGGEGGELVAVRAPLPGTFYRAPRPGAEPFVEVGSRVGADTVIGIVETMKLMNSVHAGVAGVVAEFCVANAEFAAHGTTLLRIRADA